MGIGKKPVGGPPPPIQIQGPLQGTNQDSRNPKIPGVEGNNTVGGDGVYGFSTTGLGVHGESNTSDGVSGISHHAKHAGVSGHNDKGGNAGFFDANVVVAADLTVNNITMNGKMTVQSGGDIILSDCAEYFDVSGADPIHPGTVVAIDKEGALQASRHRYDKRVAGVVSGAGDYQSAIVLGKHRSEIDAVSVALIGKAYCKVDAGYAPVEVGDLLTTSDTPGHAMKATDPARAFGAVLGKALRPLSAGTGLIPILIALQ